MLLFVVVAQSPHAISAFVAAIGSPWLLGLEGHPRSSRPTLTPFVRTYTGVAFFRRTYAATIGPRYLIDMTGGTI